jgi:hypothetical protein
MPTYEELNESIRKDLDLFANETRVGATGDQVLQHATLMTQMQIAQELHNLNLKAEFMLRGTDDDTTNDVRRTE